MMTKRDQIWEEKEISQQLVILTTSKIKYRTYFQVYVLPNLTIFCSEVKRQKKDVEGFYSRT